jgi:hypothetical protein
LVPSGVEASESMGQKGLLWMGGLLPGLRKNLGGQSLDPVGELVCRVLESGRKSERNKQH